MPSYTIPPAGSTRGLSQHWGIWGSDTLLNDSTRDIFPTLRWTTINDSPSSSLPGASNIWPLDTNWVSMGNTSWSTNGPFYKIDIVSDNSAGYRGRVGITAPFAMPFLGFPNRENAYWIRLPWFSGGPVSSFTVQAYPNYGSVFSTWRINTGAGGVWSSSNPLTINRTDSLITNNSNLRLVATFTGGTPDPVDAIAISRGADRCNDSILWQGNSLIYPPSGQNWTNATQFFTDSARTSPLNGGNNFFTTYSDLNSRVQIAQTGNVLQRTSRFLCPE